MTPHFVPKAIPEGTSTVSGAQVDEVALFGTSADPPTYGHQTILSWLCRHYYRVAVWASDNPFKQHRATLQQRLAMLECLVQGMTPPHCNLIVCPDLSHQHSIVSVARARQRWPQHEPTLAIGSDLLSQLPQWYRIDDLMQQAKFLVIPRPGYPILSGDRQRLEQLGARLKIASMTGLEVSSTAYREERSPVAVPESVEAYIRREKLYRWQNAS